MGAAARLIVYHKQATSARLRFLRLADHTVCGFGALPALAAVVEPEEKARFEPAVVPHPAPLAGRMEQLLGLPDGSVELDGGFVVRVDVPDGPLTVYLARLTSIDPPFAAAAAHGATFIDLTQARDLPRVELELLRRAYQHVMGG
ncbi:hypothetical protein [Sulfurivermis fontis]|uniref:hypothetical protein n=1 Tax=Sulfurivermis fontis TaxID=1972068 RepID=UPI000FD8532D|nr:hypothetical protein [Sulfurivermis fontis]